MDMMLRLKLVMVFAIWLMVIPGARCNNYSGIGTVLKTTYMVEVTEDLVAFRFSIDSPATASVPPVDSLAVLDALKAPTHEFYSLPAGTPLSFTVFNHIGLRYETNGKLPSLQPSPSSPTQTALPTSPAAMASFPGTIPINSIPLPSTGAESGYLSPQGAPIALTSLPTGLNNVSSTSPEIMGSPMTTLDPSSMVNLSINPAAAGGSDIQSTSSAALPSAPVVSASVILGSSGSPLPTGVMSTVQSLSSPSASVGNPAAAGSGPAAVAPLSKVLPMGGRKLLQVGASSALPSVSEVGTNGASLASPSFPSLGTNEASLASPSIAPVATIGASLASPSVGISASAGVPGVVSASVVQEAMAPQQTLFINFFTAQSIRTETMVCKNSTARNAQDAEGSEECPFTDDRNAAFYESPERRDYLPAGFKPDYKSVASYQGMCWTNTPYELIGGPKPDVTLEGLPLPRLYYLTYDTKVIGMGFAIQYRLLNWLLRSNRSQYFQGDVPLPATVSAGGSYPTKYVFAFNAFYNTLATPTTSYGVVQVAPYQFTLALTTPEKIVASVQEGVTGQRGRDEVLVASASSSASSPPSSAPVSKPGAKDNSSGTTLSHLWHVIVLVTSLCIALSVLFH